MKGGRCAALYQYDNSTISDEVFITFSKELCLNGNICEVLDKNFEFTNKYEKLYAKEFDSNYD